MAAALALLLAATASAGSIPAAGASTLPARPTLPEELAEGVRGVQGGIGRQSSIAGTQPDAAAPDVGDLKPGAVIESRRSDHLLTHLAHPGVATARTFTYVSTRSDGLTAPVTGTIYEPNTPWRGNGERPTIAFAPGTRGQGDQCAPSNANLHVASVGLGTLNFNYEYPFFQMATDQGIRVVVTDYIGLGLSGHHTYVNHVEEGNALIDAARAALQLSGAPADAPVAFAGYSQGGGAAAAAAEQVAAYAPELNVRGTYSGAPPADLREVMKAVDGSAIVHVLGYAINGFAERNPQVREAIVSNFNPLGIQFLQDAATSCIGESVLKWGFIRTSQLTKTGESFSQLADRIPVLGATLDANLLGTRPLNAPMLVANSRNDDLLPYDQARAMAGRYCALGGTVQFNALPGDAFIPGSGVNHAVPILDSVPLGLAYLIERFNGVPAPTNCQV